MKIFKVFLALCAFTLIISCAHFKNLERKLADRYGAEAMVDGETKIAPLDLITLLDPENKLCEVDRCQDLSDADGKKLNCAFEAFYRYNEGELKKRRDRLQDRLLVASNEQCREFKLKTKLARDMTDLVLGGITTLTSGLGAIFTPVTTVRALSGSAAIVSGIRAETLQTIYADKTVQVFTAAIDKRRKKIFGEIEQKRAKEINDYTVEAAISDATEYHAACTLIAALEEISAAIEKQGPTVPASKGITVSPDSLDFGEVEVHKTLERTLTIVNNGTGDLTVSIKALKGTDFVIKDTKDASKEIKEITVTVKPNKSSDLTIIFKPGQPGPETDILTGKPTDPNVATIYVPLSGKGK